MNAIVNDIFGLNIFTTIKMTVAFTMGKEKVFPP